MKIGLDYWNVISHYSDYFSQLAYGAMANEHEVHVISAIGKSRVGTIEAEVLNKMGLSIEPKNIHEVVFDNYKQSPELKLAKCKELGIEVFYDDRDDVCRLLTDNGILAMRVTRRNKSSTDLSAERK